MSRIAYFKGKNMSRGFVKEDDQEEAPFIPARAVLPPGAINYVTPGGYQKLLEEKKHLESELTGLLNIEYDKDRRHTRAILTGKLNLLNERIASARVIRPEEQSPGEVRFGAWVRFQTVGGSKIFQIVGADEADISQNKIAFFAPIARALTGKKTGEMAELKLGNKVEKLEIINIEY
ncbi:transcription elongation factor GreB [soil metagenome]